MDARGGSAPPVSRFRAEDFAVKLPGNKMAGDHGFEPQLIESESVVLPLN